MFGRAAMMLSRINRARSMWIVESMSVADCGEDESYEFSVIQGERLTLRHKTAAYLRVS